MFQSAFQDVQFSVSCSPSVQLTDFVMLCPDPRFPDTEIAKRLVEFGGHTRTVLGNNKSAKNMVECCRMPSLQIDVNVLKFLNRNIEII